MSNGTLSDALGCECKRDFSASCCLRNCDWCKSWLHFFLAS